MKKVLLVMPTYYEDAGKTRLIAIILKALHIPASVVNLFSSQVSLIAEKLVPSQAKLGQREVQCQ